MYATVCSHNDNVNYRYKVVCYLFVRRSPFFFTPSFLCASARRRWTPSLFFLLSFPFALLILFRCSFRNAPFHILRSPACASFTLFLLIRLLNTTLKSSHSISITMVSRKLMGVWVGLDILLLAAGALTLALSIVWRAPNVLMNMVISKADLTGACLFFFLRTWLSEILCILFSRHCIGHCVHSHFCDFTCGHCPKKPRHYWARHPKLYIAARCHWSILHRHIYLDVYLAGTRQFPWTLGRGNPIYPSHPSRSCGFTSFIYRSIFDRLYVLSVPMLWLFQWDRFRRNRWFFLSITGFHQQPCNQ